MTERCSRSGRGSPGRNTEAGACRVERAMGGGGVFPVEGTACGEGSEEIKGPREEELKVW